MPSLIRFLVVLMVIAAVIAGVIFYLANFVEPNPREMSVRIPPEKIEQALE